MVGVHRNAGRFLEGRRSLLVVCGGEQRPAGELDLRTVDEDALYEAMDWLGERQERIKRRLAKRHLAEGGQALHDVSSSYCEGRSCPLVRFGHSRDGKRGRPVVVYGLLADAEGRPAAVRAHPGNTADPSTLPGEVKRLRTARRRTERRPMACRCTASPV